jgi:hypothetical protein
MQISKIMIATNGINGDIQVNGNGQAINGKKEPSTYSLTTFGIQQSSKAAVDSGSHTGMSSG